MHRFNHGNKVAQPVFEGGLMNKFFMVLTVLAISIGAHAQSAIKTAEEMAIIDSAATDVVSRLMEAEAKIVAGKAKIVAGEAKIVAAKAEKEAAEKRREEAEARARALLDDIKSKKK